MVLQPKIYIRNGEVLHGDDASDAILNAKAQKDADDIEKLLDSDSGDEESESVIKKMSGSTDFCEFSSKQINMNDTRIAGILLEFTNGEREFHKYSTSIDYQKIKSKRKIFAKLLVDENISKILKSNKIINYIDELTKLYPLKTIGDGNCLVSFV
jgi:hypothetical protein